MSEIRVRPLGWFLAALALGGGSAGALWGWIEAWFVAIAAATLLFTAWPFLLGSRRLSAHLVLERTRTVVGSPIPARIALRNPAARPFLAARAELTIGEAIREVPVPWLPARAGVEIAVEVPAVERGIVPVGPLTIARRDPVGVAARDVTWPEQLRVHVHPRTVALPSGTSGSVRDLAGAASRRLADEDLAFHAVREYQPGDARRHVHWKATAKTGTLMVRQYEESQSARLAVLVDAHRDEYADATEFELGVSAAASLSLHAVREGRERTVVRAASTPPGARQRHALADVPDATPLQLLDAWAELRPLPPRALRIEAAARALAESGRPLSLVYVVTGSRPAAARLRRLGAAFAADVRVRIVRCERLADPGVSELPPVRVHTIGALDDLPRLLVRGDE